MSASLRTPTFVPFSGYLLNKYSRVLNQDLIKLHREHGGVPIPVTPETYNICLDMSRRLQPFEPFDPFIKLETNRFIKDLYTAIGMIATAGSILNNTSGNQDSKDVVSAFRITELEAALKAATTEHKNDLKSQEHKITTLNNSVKALKTEVAAVKTGTATRRRLKAEVEAHKASLAKIDMLQTEVAALKAESVALHTRFTKLGKKLISLAILKQKATTPINVTKKKGRRQSHK